MRIQPFDRLTMITDENLYGRETMTFQVKVREVCESKWSGRSVMVDRGPDRQKMYDYMSLE